MLGSKMIIRLIITGPQSRRKGNIIFKNKRAWYSSIKTFIF